MKTAVVMAFDAAMFEQAQRAIETLRRHCQNDVSLCIVAIDLSAEQQADLQALGATLFTDYRSLPFYVGGGPAYAYAMTCRPYLRDLFPGFDLYLYVDADIRFEHPDAFEFYLGQAAAEPRAIVICQEVDQAYCFVQNPPQARAYHAAKHERNRRNFGQQAADHMLFHYSYNAGLFAMHRDAPTWTSYRRSIELVIKQPFDHMAEQDALSIAIVEDGLHVRTAPTIMNWLCSIAPPLFHEQSKRWVRPIYPHLPISVLHLTNSNTKIPGDDRGRTFYDLYKLRNMTA